MTYEPNINNRSKDWLDLQALKTVFPLPTEVVGNSVEKIGRVAWNPHGTGHPLKLTKKWSILLTTKYQ